MLINLLPTRPSIHSAPPFHIPSHYVREDEEGEGGYPGQFSHSVSEEASVLAGPSGSQSSLVWWGL